MGSPSSSVAPRPETPFEWITVDAGETFVSCWWRRSVSKTDFGTAFEDVLLSAAKPKPWGSAKQPVAALVRSLARIAWQSDVPADTLPD